MTSHDNQSNNLIAMLREHAVIDLRCVDAIESGNEIVLTGTVASYYHKQLAQETIRPMLNGRHLKNRVAVKA